IGLWLLAFSLISQSGDTLDEKLTVFPARPTSSDHVVINYFALTSAPAFSTQFVNVIDNNELKIILSLVTGGIGIPPQSTLQGQVDFGILPNGPYVASFYLRVPASFDPAGNPVFGPPVLKTQIFLSVGQVTEIPTLSRGVTLLLS